MLEGSEAPIRYVIVKFDSKERARAWYAFAEYAQALAIQPDALKRRLLLVDGTVD